MSKQKVCVLGVTGSIGDSTLDVLRQHAHRFQLVAIAAGSSWQKVAKIAKEFEVEHLCMWNEEAAQKLSAELDTKVSYGMDGLLEQTSLAEVDVVVNGLVGSIGCLPTMRALEKGKRVGLANKETLVMAGTVVEEVLLANPNSKLLPIDSEHSAIFQCLQDRPVEEIETIQLTASGGPFRTLDKSPFKDITVERALKHPTWSMGPKITIDSATLMNKGLEVLEAHFLFHVPFDQIDVVVHPGSIVHSMVQFRDGSLMAQLGAPDMKVPIQYALSYPERWPLNVDRVSLPELGRLEFYQPDTDKFPCLRLAYEAGKRSGTAPAILNAANEILVPAFLEHKISFLDIPKKLEKALENLSIVDNPNLEQVLAADETAREWARNEF
jgi:1-deoxy-D-xylulose-5-phosphate reductoisomerase